MGQTQRIAMVVLMKGKINLLVRLLLSIVYHSEYDRDYLDIYIADTGSTEKEKKMVKRFIKRMEEENSLNITFIEYDHYNFSEINNDVVLKHVRKDTDIILLCNNDVELINDAISLCADECVENADKIGTIGARLMYPDNTVQHAGITVLFTKNGIPSYTHALLKKPFKINKDVKRVFSWGNTGAFMMVPYKLFIEYGMLPTGYKECFEDVEFNLNLLKSGKENITRLDAICFHNESSTREKRVDDDDIKKIRAYTIADPFFKERYDRLRQKRN